MSSNKIPAAVPAHAKQDVQAPPEHLARDRSPAMQLDAPSAVETSLGRKFSIADGLLRTDFFALPAGHA